MAAKWHVNNTRRVLRSLQVHEQTGRPHSTLLHETGGLRGHDGLQYKCVILWLDAKRDVCSAVPYHAICMSYSSFIHIDIGCAIRFTC